VPCLSLSTGLSSNALIGDPKTKSGYRLTGAGEMCELLDASCQNLNC
jgi:hypothetical protein